MEPSQLDVFKTVKEITGKTRESKAALGNSKYTWKRLKVNNVCFFRVSLDSRLAREFELTQSF